MKNEDMKTGTAWRRREGQLNQNENAAVVPMMALSSWLSCSSLRRPAAGECLARAARR
jgi:hypothetical protein